jgi:cytidylate kinase
MTVITISREFGSGGDEIASRVCEILGYQQFDKRLLAQAAQEAGLSEQEVVDYSEEDHKIRGFLDRLFGRTGPVMTTRVWREDAAGLRIMEETRLTEDFAVSLVKRAVRSAVQAGSLVIVGRGGQAILHEAPGVLHVRVIAPVENRIQRIKSQMKHAQDDFNADIDIRREAQDWIAEKDAASRDYLQRFFGADWSDPRLYHMVLNTGKLTIDQAASLIVRLARALELDERAEGAELATA